MKVNNIVMVKTDIKEKTHVKQNIKDFNKDRIIFGAGGKRESQ